MPSMTGYGSENKVRLSTVIIVFVLWLAFLAFIFIAVNYGGGSPSECNPEYEGCVPTSDLSDRPIWR